MIDVAVPKASLLNATKQPQAHQVAYNYIEAYYEVRNYFLRQIDF